MISRRPLIQQPSIHSVHGPRRWEGPLHFEDLRGGMWGVWAVFSHPDCLAVMKDPRISAKRTGHMLFTLPASRHVEFRELCAYEACGSFIDAPEHTRLRKLMNKGFSQSAEETLRTQVEKIVNRMRDPYGTMTVSPALKSTFCSGRLPSRTSL